MLRLKNAHHGGRAAVIFGGPSLIARGFDFGRLRDRGFVTFLETKALTPAFLRHGLTPDYFLMAFPEKTKDNTLQHFVFRSFLAQRKIDRFLKREYQPVVDDMRARFDELFEHWRPHRGAHKRYRYRPRVYLKDSPYELLEKIPGSRLIVNRELVEHYFPEFAYADRAFYFGHTPPEERFEIDKYFNPIEQDGLPLVQCANTFSNSAAISLYPLLRYMGFSEVYFLGMDMSIIGSFEYSAPFTFRSMLHYWWFLHRNEHVYSGNPLLFRHGWLFDRPQVEFEAIRDLWRQAPLRFVQVYEPWKYAWPIEGIPTVSYEQLWKI